MEELMTRLKEMRIKEVEPYLISRELQDKELMKLINYVLETGDIDDEDDLVVVEEFVSCCKYVYEKSGDFIPITDSQYDVLVDILNDHHIDIWEDQSLTSKDVGVHHRYKSLRGTLEKIYALSNDDELDNGSRRTLPDWIKSKERQLKEFTGKEYDLSHVEVYYFPKFDGVSVIFEIDETGKLKRALTRGNTKTNEAKDVTNVFKDFEFENKGIPYGLKTEVMVSNTAFDNFHEKYSDVGMTYSSCRSLASAFINSDNSTLASMDKTEYLTIVPLRFSIDEDSNIPELANEVYDYPSLHTTLDNIQGIKDFAEDVRNVRGLKTDGVVIYLNDSNLQMLLGRKNDKSQYEVAYKFTEESTYSKIEDIEFSVGRFGNIIPVAIIKPVVMKGNTIKRISMGSLKRFFTLNLAKGDKVKVLYDIVPYLVFNPYDKNCKRSKNEPIPMITNCPECGDILVTSNENQYSYSCKNPSCPHIKKGKILNYLEKMNIKYLSLMTVDKLYELDYLRSIKDLYTMKNHENEISMIMGLGKSSIHRIIDEIETHKKVTTTQFLGSLGIEGIGEKTFERVFAMLNYKEFMDFCNDDKKIAIGVLSVIPYINEKTAEKIYDGIHDNRKLIKALEKELDLIDYKRNYETSYHVVFTKVRDKELEDFILANNGRVEDSVKKTTSLVIIPNADISSSKLSKAKKYEIPVVTIDKAKDYIQSHFIK